MRCAECRSKRNSQMPRFPRDSSAGSNGASARPAPRSAALPARAAAPGAPLAAAQQRRRARPAGRSLPRRRAAPPRQLAPSAAPCAPCSLPHASRPPARPVAARMPRSRPCAPRPPPARPAADAAHTPRYRLRAPQSAARPAAALAPRSSATCSARPPRQTLRGWLPPMPNLLASPTAPPLPSAPPSASLPCACGRAFGTRRGRPGRGCGGGGGPAGCPRPERCLGTENGSVR